MTLAKRFNTFKKITRQTGQGMVEYVVVLVFGVMILTVGPGGDVLLDLLAVMHDNHQGYSYSASLSTLPDQDNAGDAYADELLDKLGSQIPDGFGGFEAVVPEMPSMDDIIAEGVESVLSF
jgi:hypothetical protein